MVMEAIETREERGLSIARHSAVHRNGRGWLVPSQSGAVSYLVDPEQGTCTCADHATRGVKCKHLWAVEFTKVMETSPDGTVRVTKMARATYSQEWTVYNAAEPVFWTSEADRPAAPILALNQPF